MIADHTCPFCTHGDIYMDQSHHFCMDCGAIWNEAAEKGLVKAMDASRRLAVHDMSRLWEESETRRVKWRMVTVGATGGRVLLASVTNPFGHHGVTFSLAGEELRSVLREGGIEIE